MILISAAKTMNDVNNEKKINLNKSSEKILKIINEYSKNDMGDLFKIKGKTLDKTYKYYIEFNDTAVAILKYNGIVFKELENKENLKLYKDVYIISALYGIVSSKDLISSYRLDFNSNKIVGFNLYKYWEDYIEDYIIKKNPKMILNLCSNEYFNAIGKEVRNKFKIINIECIEKVSSTSLKKIRGDILNYTVKNNIQDYTKLEGKQTKYVKFIDFKDNKLIFELKE